MFRRAVPVAIGLFIFSDPVFDRGLTWANLKVPGFGAFNLKVCCWTRQTNPRARTQLYKGKKILHTTPSTDTLIYPQSIREAGPNQLPRL